MQNHDPIADSRIAQIGIPFPLALARLPPMAGARSVVEIADAYHAIAKGAPPDDVLLAALYAYVDLRPEQRELALLLALIRQRGTVPETVSQTVTETIA